MTLKTPQNPETDSQAVIQTAVGDGTTILGQASGDQLRGGGIPLHGIGAVMRDGSHRMVRRGIVRNGKSTTETLRVHSQAVLVHPTPTFQTKEKERTKRF